MNKQHILKQLYECTAIMAGKNLLFIDYVVDESDDICIYATDRDTMNEYNISYASAKVNGYKFLKLVDCEIDEG